MVRHQAVPVGAPAAASGEFVQQREEPDVVLGVEEDLLPPIASRGDVEGATSKLTTGCPRHGVEGRPPPDRLFPISQPPRRIARLWSHVRGQTPDVAAVDALKLVVTLSGVL